MPPLYATQNVLSGGEVSPQLSARFDQPRYQTGAQLMKNCVPMPQGGVTKRPGMVHCGLARHQSSASSLGGSVRLTPFVFSATQGRMLEFGPNYVRFWLADGRLVLKNSAPYVVETPYGAADVPGLVFAQSADVVFIASPQHPPRKLCRYADDNWKFASITFMPSIATPGKPKAEAQGSSPGSGNVTYSYKVSVIDAATGEESLPSAAVDLACSALTQTYFVLISVTAVPGAAEYRFYKKKGGVYGFIGRATDGVTSFEDRNLGADTEDTPPNAKNPFLAAGNYPSQVFFHQQRLGFAATLNRPLTVWLSQSGNFESMAASIPPKDDDAIEATLAANQVNRIVWATPDRTALALGTEGGEWLLTATDGAVLTPSNLNFEPQTSYGSSGEGPGVANATGTVGVGLGPLRAGSGLLYVQRGGSVVREFSYSFSADRYESSDLTLVARHMLQDRHVVAWAWQQEPYSLVWCALSDGTLAALTYMREQEVVGWHRHETDGRIEGVATMPGMPDDAVWFVVRRTRLKANNTPETLISIERLAPFFDSPDKETAFCVDGGLSYTGNPVASFTGLNHLEGRQVALFCDGYVHPPRTVRQGEITLDRPASVVQAGLPYTGEIIPTLPESVWQNGATLLKVRKINAIKLRLYRSMSFDVALGDQPSQPLAAHQVVSGKADPTPWWTERADVALVTGGGWSEGEPLRLIMRDPTPATVLAMVTTLEIAQWAGGQG